MKSGHYSTWTQVFDEKIHTVELNNDLLSCGTQTMALRIFSLDNIILEKESPLFNLNVGSKSSQYTMQKSENQMYPGR